MIHKILAKFADTILENMDDGQLTDVAFLDLSKALDTVNHSRLLLKLKSIGFSSHVCEWFKSYLTHRCQVTVVDNKQSSVKHMNIGVPQGSILGPLLFIIYVNELPNCITSCDISIYFFAVGYPCFLANQIASFAVRYFTIRTAQPDLTGLLRIANLQ